MRPIYMSLKHALMREQHVILSLQHVDRCDMSLRHEPSCAESFNLFTQLSAKEMNN